MYRVQANLACRDHPDAVLIEDHRAGDMICRDCGLVVGDRVVDVSQEWRTFSENNSDPSRVGGAENPLLESDLSTTIGAATGPGGLDDQGNPKYRNRSMMSTENRTLTSAFKEIDIMSDRGRLPKTIKDHAKLIFKKAHDNDKDRTTYRSRLPIVAAALFHACRNENSSRSYKEVSAMTGVTIKKLTKAATFIDKTCGKQNQGTSSEDWMDSFMPRNCSELGLSELIPLATHIANRANAIGETLGRSHVSVAAAAIYLAVLVSGTKKPLKDICVSAGCAEGTLKQVYKKMLGKVREVLPPDYVPKVPIEQLPQV